MFTNPIEFFESEMKRLFDSVTIVAYNLPYSIDEIIQDINSPSLIAIVPNKPETLQSESGEILDILDNVTIFIKSKDARLKYLALISNIKGSYEENNTVWELQRKIVLDDANINHINKELYYEINYKIN